MNFNVILYVIIKMLEVKAIKPNRHNIIKNKDLGDHTTVTNSEVFPYVVAILEKSNYISAGALINERWVLTAADSLYVVRESIRLIKVRLGSINYKKGGILLPIKSFEIHPFFDDSKPEFDLALILLPQPVKFKANVYPISLLTFQKEVMATHFIVNAWLSYVHQSKHLESLETIRHRRMLTVSHLHPTNKEVCSQEITHLGFKDQNQIMCLEPSLGGDPCEKDVGGPVVLNGVLWGIVSSWKADDCDVNPGYTFVTLVSANNISDWIHATTHGHKWVYQLGEHDSNYHADYDYTNYENDD